jgi:hypothetical protein
LKSFIILAIREPIAKSSAAAIIIDYEIQTLSLAIYYETAMLGRFCQATA